MIIRIVKSNLELINGSFLDYNYILSELSNPFAKVLVYVKNDLVLGYIYYSDIYDRIEINKIEVLKDYRRCGIASMLVDEVMKLGKSITLEVREDNKAARSLYEKYEFKEVAVRKGYYGNVDGILMIYEKK